MPFTINRYQLLTDPDSIFPFTVGDDAINSSKLSINLLGIGSTNYALSVAQDLVWLMENFAGPNEPTNKIVGQVWYNSTSDQLNFRSINEVWKGLSSSTISAYSPPGPSLGDLWYNSTTNALSFWNGSIWQSLGQAGTGAVSITNNGNNILVMQAGGQDVAIFSAAQFTPSPPIAGFPEIFAGMTMNNGSYSNIDSGNHLPLVDASYYLGSPTLRWLEVDAVTGNFITVNGTDANISGTLIAQTIQSNNYQLLDGTPLSTLGVEQNGTPVTTSTSVLNFTGPGVTVSNSGSVVTVDITGGGAEDESIIYGSQTYKTAGNYTFTIPPNVTSLTVEAWGAGAGGGSGNIVATGGGGAGAYGFKVLTGLIPGQTINITVGAGGSGGTSGGNGTDGGNTIIGTYLTVNGGHAGIGNAGSGAGEGAGGSVPSMADIGIAGGDGWAAFSDTFAGHGGISPRGGDGGLCGQSAGTIGNNPGGGGSGSVSGSGGNGADGAVVLSYLTGASPGVILTQCYLEISSTTQLSLIPFGGNILTNPASGSQTIPVTGVVASSLNCYVNGVAAQSLLANTQYYVYEFSLSGVPTLDFSTTSWIKDANTGLPVKTGDISRVLVGLCQTNNSAEFVRGMVISYWNRKNIPITTGVVGTSSAATPTPTSLLLNFVSWSDESISYNSGGSVYNSTANAALQIQPCIDSSLAGYASFFYSPTANQPGPVSIGGFNNVSEGYHTLTIYMNTYNGGQGFFNLGLNICVRG